MKNIFLSGLLFASLFSITSCKDKEKDALVGTGNVTIEFDNRAGDESLELVEHAHVWFLVTKGEVNAV